MLLTNRRHRLIFVSLAAIDVAGLLPWIALLIDWWAQGGDPLSAAAVDLLLAAPLATFLTLWLVQLAFMLTGDLLNRYAIGSPGREVVILLLILGSSLTTVRLLVYPNTALLDLHWLHETVRAVYNFTQALRGELIIVLTAFFLWARVASYTDRGLSFFAVGFSFRMGLLLALVGNSILAERIPTGMGASVVYFTIFLAFGLIAVALARIDQKAVGAHNSSGALLPWPRLGQLIAAVGLVFGFGWALATILTPRTLRIFLGWFAPVGNLLQWLLIQFVFLFFWIFGPILEALAAYLQGILAEIPAQEATEFAPPIEPLTITTLVREWSLLRYCLVTGAIVLVIALIWLFFVRTRLYDRRNEEEDVEREDIQIQRGRFGLNLDRLRAWLALAGRYGVGRRLLDAITVENIYANLVRLARQRGYRRPPAMPPDRFIVTLRQAFPGHADDLATVTAIYMRVRYGDRAAGADEVSSVRRAYERIVADPEPDSSDDS